MFNIMCDNCDSFLVALDDETLSNYLNQVDYLNDSIDTLCSKALSTSAYYKCPRCSLKYTYTIDEVVNKFKEQLIFDIKKYRKIHIFKNYINPMIIKPDNGLLFCGLCAGIDNKGNCYVDIIKQCPFKVKNNEL